MPILLTISTHSALSYTTPFPPPLQAKNPMKKHPSPEGRYSLSYKGGYSNAFSVPASSKSHRAFEEAFADFDGEEIRHSDTEYREEYRERKRFEAEETPE